MNGRNRYLLDTNAIVSLLKGIGEIVSSASWLGISIISKIEYLALSKLVVHLADDGELHVLLSWFPWLQNATPDEREHWQFIGKGSGIHWEEVDEDLSVLGLLRGEGVPS
mgnify:CR=1 FL=1